jgi:hypothetical protein
MRCELCRTIRSYRTLKKSMYRSDCARYTVHGTKRIQFLVRLDAITPVQKFKN